MVPKNMLNKLIATADGSHTVLSAETNETYHSENGAINESVHVYIQNGLSQITKNEMNILEIGFGTGLNALLTYQYALEHTKQINYFSIEKFPLGEELIGQLNYPEQLKIEKESFLRLHNCKWDNWEQINNNFKLFKQQADLTAFDFTKLKNIDLVYFDAFSSSKQPELWTEKIFKQLYQIMLPDGLLTTYSSAGIVKRALRAAGFKVKRKPGPKGKFHMLNAFRVNSVE